MLKKKTLPPTKLTPFSYVVDELVKALKVFIEVTAERSKVHIVEWDGDHLEARSQDGKLLGDIYLKYRLAVKIKLPFELARWFVQVYDCATTRNIGHAWTIEYRDTETQAGLTIRACDGETYRYDLPKA